MQQGHTRGPEALQLRIPKPSMGKETYQRDLQKRPTKETYKRDPHIPQKDLSLRNTVFSRRSCSISAKPVGNINIYMYMHEYLLY